MAGDYSRQRFDPKQNFAGVLMQQGRVQLDSDWNEGCALLDRRWRAETTDIIGRGTVPMETPDGFRIQISAGALTIGRGRIYVDGLLAENFGISQISPPNMITPPIDDSRILSAIPGRGTFPSGLLSRRPISAMLEFDEVLSEERGISKAIPYDKQPYFPNASEFPLPTSTGPHLVYIDVWRREVTHLEEPHLIEKAVNTDTTTRWQTVWQVKILPDVGSGVKCDTELQEWKDLIAPSDARLSTAKAKVPTSTDPCLLPPSGGYRGLENRLNRVEIHDGGPQGTATFKWSHDNTSVSARVTAIKALSELTVSSIGRDSANRFKTGDWVEITDDWLELGQQPGVMAKILDVVSERQLIKLSASIPAGVFKTDADGNTDPNRHTRLVRWDHSGQVRDTNGNLLVDLNTPGTRGVIPVPPAGTAIILEDGVQITFDTPAGGNYHVGDYWNFAARTIDGSVEELMQASPLGIHHHYCRLALVTFPLTPTGTPSVTDCRKFWPPEVEEKGCDCTVCVSADSHNKNTLTIQQAIDKVITEEGGTVCLGPGTYDLGDLPIAISKACSLRLRGQGINTDLRYTGRGPALLIQDSEAVVVEEVMIVARRNNPELPVVNVRSSNHVTLQQNTILQLGESKDDIAAIGLEGQLIGTTIRENALFAPVGIGNSITIAQPLPQAFVSRAVSSKVAPLATASLHITKNAIFGGQRGVSLVGMSVHTQETRVTDNLIRNCLEGGIVLLGYVSPGFGLDVCNNQILAKGAGIVIGINGARISENNIGAEEGNITGDGIVLGVGLDHNGLDECQVLANRITGRGGNGIFITGNVNSAVIKNNIIQSVDGGGIIMDDKSRAKTLSIENNQLHEITPKVPKQENWNRVIAGIRVVNADQVDISHNVITGLGEQAPQNPDRVAIQLIGADCALVSCNEISDIAPPDGFANLSVSVGIESIGTFGRLKIVDNNIRRSQKLVADPEAEAKWYGVRIQGSINRRQPPSFRIPVATKGKRSFIFVPQQILSKVVGTEVIELRGNCLDVYGSVPAIDIESNGVSTLDGNQCFLRGRDQAVVKVQARAVIATANYLKGVENEKVPTMELEVTAPQDPRASLPLTATGNITNEWIQINAAPLTSPWKELNVIA